MKMGRLGEEKIWERKKERKKEGEVWRERERGVREEGREIVAVEVLLYA